MSLEHRNLVDPDLGDTLPGPMRQAILHDPLDGPEHASPVGFKDLGTPLSRTTAGPSEPRRSCNARSFAPSHPPTASIRPSPRRWDNPLAGAHCERRPDRSTAECTQNLAPPGYHTWASSAHSPDILAGCSFGEGSPQSPLPSRRIPSPRCCQTQRT